jgi:acyl-CoA thioester hydrolase
MLTEHTHTFRVRYHETDGQGIVHHTNYIVWFEMGRVELMRANGHSYRALEESGIMTVIAEVACKFYAPARFDDEVRLITRLVRAAGARIEHAYQVFRDDTLLAEGSTTVACIDREGRVRRLPAWLRTQPNS